MLQLHNFIVLYGNKQDYYECNKYSKGFRQLKKGTKSLLEELNSIAVKKNTDAVIESRAAHIIDSAMNILSTIKENYPADQADELERRFINSIRTGDPNKFVRGIRKFRDNKEEVKKLEIFEKKQKQLK